LKLKVHRTRGKEIIKAYRIIPYPELVKVLEDDGIAFLEDGERQLKRGTVWKAARRLTEIMGKPVKAEHAYLRFTDGTYLAGYSFYVAEPKTKEKKQSLRH
jgi:hypothetical protein